MTRKWVTHVVTCMVTMALALGMAVLGVMPRVALAGEDEVRAVSEGVFKINMSYALKWTQPDGKPVRDAAGNEVEIIPEPSRGTAFLINDEYVLTCYHCVMISDSTIEYLKASGVNTSKLLKSFKYTVTISRDVEIPCKLVNYSKTEDWALLKLSQKVGGTKSLKLRSSSSVKNAEEVWSVGFPTNADNAHVANTYRPDDATIKNGTVSKAESIMEFFSAETVVALPSPQEDLGMHSAELVRHEGDIYLYKLGFPISGNFIQTSVPITAGDSGGPIVDDNGCVVGISESGGEYYNAVAIDSVIKALDRLNIKYEAIENVPDPDSNPVGYSLNTQSLAALIETAKAANKNDYEAADYQALSEAITDAEAAVALTLDDDSNETEYKEKNSEIQDAEMALENALDKKIQVSNNTSATTENVTDADVSNTAAEKTKNDDGEGLNPVMIGAIVAAAVLAVALIVVLVRGKKKPEAVTQPTPQPAPQPTPQPQPVAPRPQQVNDAPPTTVFTNDDPATTILTEDVNGGTLTRMSTNETIQINRSELSIGRERASVDYCLEGNTNISRVHARVVVRDGRVFIVDNNAANGTFVNNARLRSGVEQELRGGDIIRLADEKFRYDR